MANIRITDLTAYTDAASTDVLPIVDVSNNVTKKVSISDLLKATPLGSAAAPAIAIDGDPNTGIYSPGADQLAVSTAGTGRLFIDSSGRVGIGTTNPQDSVVNIATSSAAGAFNPLLTHLSGGFAGSHSLHLGAWTSTGTDRIYGCKIKTNYNYASSGATALSFEVTNAGGSLFEAARIDSAGNVGIGTSSPGSLLDVRFPTSPNTNNGNGFNTFRVWTSSALAADTGGAISLGGVSATGGAASSFGQIAGRKVNATSADYAGYLQFSVNNAVGTMLEAMRINNAGRVGIGTSSPDSLLDVNGAVTARGDGSLVGIYLGSGCAIRDIGTGSSTYIDLATGSASHGSLIVRSSNAYTERMRVAGGGEIYFPSVGTTASAANAFLNNASSPANQLLRSTSSRRYKTDIEDLQDQNADAILGLRPVWYRSLAEADRKDWSWYGLIAEEVAEVEPRLVFWTYLEDAYEEVDDKRQLKADAEMVPDGVQYDRLTVLLLDLVQRQNERIETLEAKVAALEAA